MRRLFCAALMACAPHVVFATPLGDTVQEVVEDHILPRVQRLDETSQVLSQAAVSDCDVQSQVLRAAFGSAFDEWIAVSHLRFGPSERDDRAFALAFWPDSRGATPKALRELILQEDPAVSSQADFSEVSIAARGFYALEFLLFDDALADIGSPDYRCLLVQAVAADIAKMGGAIRMDWENGYVSILTSPSTDGVYRTDEEAAQELFKALSTGLEFTSEARLGRPLGTFERPRPNRAEARRSERSARHVDLVLSSTADLARALTVGDEELIAKFETAFGRTETLLEALDDPSFAGVAEPQSRLRVEVLQQAVDDIRAVVRDELGPKLGVAAGFNSLDGD